MCICMYVHNYVHNVHSRYHCEYNVIWKLCLDIKTELVYTVNVPLHCRWECLCIKMEHRQINIARCFQTSLQWCLWPTLRKLVIYTKYSWLRHLSCILCKLYRVCKFYWIPYGMLHVHRIKLLKYSVKTKKLLKFEISNLGQILLVDKIFFAGQVIFIE